MILTIRRVLFFTLLLGLLGAPAAQAQPSAEEVLQRMVEQAENSMANVDNFIVETEVDGLPVALSMTTYYQRDPADTTGAYRMHTDVQTGGPQPMQSQQAGQADLLTMNRRLRTHLAGSARVTGTESIDGEKTYVLAADDISSLYQDLRGAAPSGQEVTARNARVYVDADDYVLRRVTADVHLQQDGQERVMKMNTTLSDYRTTGPMLHPYMRTIQMDYQMSEQEKTQLKQRIQQMESMMDQMPEEKKAQIEKQLEAMRSLAEGQTTMRMTVQDMQVNEGIPEGTFE